MKRKKINTRTQAYMELAENLNKSLEDATFKALNVHSGVTNAILLNIAGSLATVADVLATKEGEQK